MDTRKVFVVAVLGILILVQPVHGQQGLKASPNSASIPIGLGFSKGTITPVSEGVPVFVVGDQLWFEFYLPDHATVSLTEPCSSVAASTDSCPSSSLLGTDLNSLTVGVTGNTSVQLMTFSNADLTGLWTLAVNSDGQNWTVDFMLVEGGAPVQLTGYSVDDGGEMSLSYAVASGSVYDLSACRVGNQSTSTAYVPIPETFGGGTLLLSLNGSSISAIPQQSLGNFSVWVGLSQSYGYQLNNQTVATRETQVAETEPVVVTKGITGSFSTALDDIVPMRTGEYTLSVNYETGQAASVQDTNVLVTGSGSWIWLENCYPSSGVLSNTVTVSGSLQEGPSVWPRYVYMVYEEYGVSLYSVASVSPQPSTVTLEASGWDHQLTDSQIDVYGVSDYSVGNGSVYILGTGYPLNVSVAASQVNVSQIEIEKPYTALQVSVPADRIVVDTLSGGTQLSGIDVSLTDTDGLVFAENSTAGAAVFYVPQGHYAVSATYDGVTQSQNVTAESAPADETLGATLQFGTTGSLLVLALLALLGAGVVASGVVWAVLIRRRRQLQMKDEPQPPLGGREKTEGFTAPGAQLIA